MIEVNNNVKVYEVNGVECPAIVNIQSHWNENNFIVIATMDGIKLTVDARDLRAAIDNATNSARF